jgi:hypothetical protein
VYREQLPKEERQRLLNRQTPVPSWHHMGKKAELQMEKLEL